MKNKILYAFEQDTPDVLSGILSVCAEADGKHPYAVSMTSMQPRRSVRKAILESVGIAAVLVLVLGGVIGLFWLRQNYVQQPVIDPPPSTVQTTAPTDAPPVSTFEPYDWASRYTIVDDREFSRLDGASFEYNALPGDLYMSEFLLQYLSAGTDASQVYSVYVLERTGASREEVYQNLIQHLDVSLDVYMERETIHVTQDQLLAIEWPEEYGIILGVAPDYSAFYPNVEYFTKEELEGVETDYIPVWIGMEYPVALSPQDLEAEQERIASTYGLRLEFTWKNPYYACAFATPEQLLALLDDPFLCEIRNMKSLSDLRNWDS